MFWRYSPHGVIPPPRGNRRPRIWSRVRGRGNRARKRRRSKFLPTRTAQHASADAPCGLLDFATAERFYGVNPVSSLQKLCQPRRATLCNSCSIQRACSGVRRRAVGACLGNFCLGNRACPCLQQLAHYEQPSFAPLSYTPTLGAGRGGEEHPLSGVVATTPERGTPVDQATFPRTGEHGGEDGARLTRLAPPLRRARVCTRCS